MMITQIVNFCNQDEHDTSKTVKLANQSEVPNKQYSSVACFSSVKTKSRYFMIPFAVADINYNNPGTPSLEKYLQNINIQAFAMNFKPSFSDQPTIVFFCHIN